MLSVIGSKIGRIMSSMVMYSAPHQMDPLFPTDGDGALADMALKIVRSSSALGGRLHPVTRGAVVDLLRQMNCYYSNLIEGHRTHPVEIERALAEDYSAQPDRRALQLEARAHVQVQRLMEDRLGNEPTLEICSTEFLRWVHSEFYRLMPPEFRKAKDEDGRVRDVVPGDLRISDVSVGRHVAPSHQSVLEFLRRFHAAYEPLRLEGVHAIIGAAASHHRLAWIHPFVDGNGRVARLFTDAYMTRAGADGHGLWSISRGMARRSEECFAALASADSPRRGDLDGRGNLSDEALRFFCSFFLRTALDQIEFMSGLLELDELQQRLKGFVERLAGARSLKPQAFHLLREALLRGEIPRGEAARITGMAERTAREVLTNLLERGMLRSATPKGLVRLGFPTEIVGYLFPRLYPEGAEDPSKVPGAT